MRSSEIDLQLLIRSFDKILRINQCEYLKYKGLLSPITILKCARGTLINEERAKLSSCLMTIKNDRE
jgi:hypothetical protein